jgi:hypothetical protein
MTKEVYPGIHMNILQEQRKSTGNWKCGYGTIEEDKAPIRMHTWSCREGCREMWEGGSSMWV